MATGPATRSPRDYFYGEVLTLPPGTKHPDHYTLLGLRFFEDDHHTILRAALDRIRLLETCQVDPRPGYQRMAERLLVEVRDAQITLLDPNKRSDYDAALIGRQERARRAESGDEEMHLAVGAMYGGRYRILREMRVGLLGVVYEAMDKNLRAKVHLSVLRPRLSRDRARRRPIEHAARRAATADHPNLLRLDEVGEADGAFFVRTRATDAKSLRLVLDSAPERMLPPEEVRRIGLQIAQALVRLHKGGGAHGRLRLDSVLVEEDGRVLVSDAFVARAVMDAIAQQHAPEASPAGDVVALGVLLYRLLTGNRYRRNGHELNLPEDIDPSFAAAMQSLLAADTAARPADGAAVVALLEPAPATVTGNVMRSKWPWIAGAAAILLGVGLSMGSSRDPAPDTAAAEARAWRSVAEGRYDEVIAELTPRREPVFAPPLARALELGAVADERAGNVWRAQRRLSDAQRIEPNARREVAYARVERAARERLDAVALPESAASREAVLRLDTKKAHLRSVRVEGEDLDLSRGVAEKRFDFPDGTHDVACELEDEAGNRRRATLRFVVDKTPPEITIEAPRPGEKFPTRDIIVRARVSDRQVLGRVTIAGREVPVRDGVASATLQLDDGDHDLVVEALDRAGNVATATRRVFVDSTAPTIALDADRLVTSSGTVTIAGRVRGRAKRLTIGGAPVPIVDDRFEQTIAVQRDRTVELVAESGSGLVQKKSVAVVVDTKPPSVTVIHSRRDAAGVLLYGAQEMDETFVSIRLRVRDKTVVTYETSNGTVVNGNKAPVWRVPARGGRHKAKLRAIDEAGLATAVAIELEGRRHTPHLAVKCPVRDQGFIRDQNVTLEIDADGPVLVQGERRSPGRHKVALNEGRVELAVVASDRYGNEVRWTRMFVVDRTKPKLELLGSGTIGVGRRELRFKADEPLENVKCFGRVFAASGDTATVTENFVPGKKVIYVTARDRAGNSERYKFTINVRNQVLKLEGKGAVRVALGKDAKLGAFTLECWVKGEPPKRTMAVLSNYYNGGFAIMWSRSAREGAYAVWHSTKGGRRVIPVKRAWSWDEWTHLALVFDGKKMRFFVDGSLQGSAETRDLAPSARDLYVGADPSRAGTANYFVGEIDEVRLSSSARYTRGFTPLRYFKDDPRTLLLLRFDDMVQKDRHPDASPFQRHGRSSGPVRLRAVDR